MVGSLCPGRVQLLALGIGTSGMGLCFRKLANPFITPGEEGWDGEERQCKSRVVGFL